MPGAYDVVVAGGTLTYGQMATAAGLAQIAAYADGVGPPKNYVIPIVEAFFLRATPRPSCATRMPPGWSFTPVYLPR